MRASIAFRENIIRSEDNLEVRSQFSGVERIADCE